MARKRPTASIVKQPVLALLVVVATGLILAASASAVAVSPPLGSATTYAVLGAQSVTNTGASVVTGDLGVAPATSIAGFPPGKVIGTVHNADTSSTAAQTDIGTAFGSSAGEPCDVDLTGQNLGGMTLPPGVYCFSSSAQLTGVLKLDAQGSPTAAWFFKITSGLTTASNAAVVLVNGAQQCTDNITWHIGSSATIGSGSIFLGNILANTSITLATGANSTGGLYAHTGAVTMDTNKISTCGGVVIPPPPPLSISTTPSGGVSAGSSVSDSATVDGGLSPTGSVTFKLYGPTDQTCTGTPVATRTGTLVGRTAQSGDVVATAQGTYNWVAAYGGDANNAPITSPCGSEKVLVTPPRTLTGRAYGLTATTTLAGIPLIDVVPTPDTGRVSTTSSSSTSTLCVASLPGLVVAHVLCANVTTSATLSKSTASASVADVAESYPSLATGAVQSTSTTTCAGSTGTTTIAYLKVGGTVVIAQPTAIAPNTALSVGPVSLVLNEQIPFHTPDDGLTVNAVHAQVNTLGLAQSNVVIASSESDIGGC